MARQNLLFNYFACTLAAEIRAAKAEGRYFEGVSDLGGSHVSKVEPQVLKLALCPPADPVPWKLLWMQLAAWHIFCNPLLLYIEHCRLSGMQLHAESP